ncbi:MAG: sigma-54 dependent transcriptional regulator [Myxococcota bacterium]
MTSRILVVDDDAAILKLINQILKSSGYEVVLAETGEKALALLDDSIYAILLDMKMPKMSGEETLREAKKRFPDLPVIMLTAHGTIRSAVDLIKAGAYDYLTKPIDKNLLLKTLKNGVENYNLKREIASLKSSFDSQYHFRNLIGKSPAMQTVLYLANQVIDSDVSILITGESGTGKEVIARAIHTASNRRNAPFVAVNCAAIPFDLLESQMFGHKKGSFTGAISDQQGKFEQAKNGTILLDEISEMPLALQAKLLRVLQEREFTPLGSAEVIALSARVIATSNRSMKRAIKEGNFRSDLYYRIAVMTINIPPLRERREDIPLFIDHFLTELTKKGHKCKGLTPDTLDFLVNYRWDGNVRQLENVLTRAALVAGDDFIRMEHLPEEILRPMTDPNVIVPPYQLRDEGGAVSREELERQSIERVLKMYNGNVSRAARELKIGRATLYRKMKRYEIDSTESEK